MRINGAPFERIDIVDVMVYLDVSLYERHHCEPALCLEFDIIRA